MRTSVRAPVLALGLAVALSACGKSEEKASSTPTASAPKAATALRGEGWIGSPVDPTVATGRVRALAFFKPG
jgi:hypothetical protein